MCVSCAAFIEANSISIPRSLDLFEGLSFGFRQMRLYKQEAGHADCGIDPEGLCGTQRVVKEGEGIG